MVIGSRSKKDKVIKVGSVAAILLVCVVAIAVLLVWLFGNNTVEEQPVKKSVPKPATAPPRLPTKDTIPFAAKEYLTTPVAPGMNAMINIKTAATAHCTIKVTHNGVVSTDSGLHDKVADEYGNVSWSWTVPVDTRDGSWPIDMYCYLGDKSAYLHQDIVVSKNAT